MLVPMFLEVTKLKSSKIAHGIKKVFVLTFFPTFPKLHLGNFS